MREKWIDNAKGIAILLVIIGSVQDFNTLGTLGTELSYLLRKKQSDKA